MAYATSLAGSKLRAKLGASLNEHVSAPTSSFAQQQLKQMGWSEGSGLGKNRQGVASHIKVKRREDNVGLGHSDVPSHQQQWWKDTVGDTLAKLSSKKKKKKTKKRDYTDEELFEATGGARFGMRAQRRAEAKWARSESQTEDDERAALARAEWNGHGNAEIVLDEDRPKTKQKEVDVVSEISSDTSGTESHKKKKEKKAKKDSKKRKRDEVVTESSTETSRAESNKTNKKEAKKDKKRKKKSNAGEQ